MFSNPLGRQVRLQGFTLIELMIVVSIIGVLASIVVPKFADMVRRAQEGRTKASLGAFRSALSIYYSDMEGLYPSSAAGIGECNTDYSLSGNVDSPLDSLIVNGKYISALPLAMMPPYHTTGTSPVTGLPPWLYLNGCNPGIDIGLWLYDSAAADANWGSMWVSCIHTDSKGTIWSAY